MKEIGLATGQKWKTRNGDIVQIIDDAKDHQPFLTTAGTWHFIDGTMWGDEGRTCGGDLVLRLDGEGDEDIHDVSTAADLLNSIRVRALTA